MVPRTMKVKIMKIKRIHKGVNVPQNNFGVAENQEKQTYFLEEL